MKKSNCLLIIILLGFSFAGRAQEMTLESILDKYYKTIGMEKMKDWNTTKMSGKTLAQGMEFPFSVTIKRPDRIRIEAEVQGMKMIQAYDGKKGWSVTPWSGTTDAQDMTDDQNKVMKDQTEMEGSLYNWKEKGYKVELIGKEDFEGSPVYKIKVTKVNGDITVYSIDAENFVELRSVSTVKIQGNETESESLSSDYKEEHGVLVPHAISNKYKDQVVSQVVINSVEINIDVPDSLFVKPVKK
jgi:outer membrane lipoprotein-sorting protein